MALFYCVHTYMEDKTSKKNIEKEGTGMGKETATYAGEIARELLVCVSDNGTITEDDFNHAMKRAGIDHRRKETRKKYYDFFIECNFLRRIWPSNEYEVTPECIRFAEKRIKKTQANHNHNDGLEQSVMVARQ